MASIRKEFEVPLPADTAWKALRDFGAVDRLAAGFVTQSVPEEDGAVRLVTFFNGMQVRERQARHLASWIERQLVALDEAQKRIVYTAVGGRATHHNAAAQVVEIDPQRCRFVWITDLLPDALAPAIEQMMEQGAQAMRSALTPPAR